MNILFHTRFFRSSFELLITEPFKRYSLLLSSLRSNKVEEVLFQDETNYISKVAKTEKEICSLIEAGFEYVTEFEGLKFFRKRKT